MPLYSYYAEKKLVYVIIVAFSNHQPSSYSKYIKWVLNRLYKENMPVAIKKCKFYTKKTNFVRFIIKLKYSRR